MDPLSCMLSFGLACASAQVDAPGAKPADVAAETPPAGPAAPASASEALTRVQAFYDGLSDLQAKFSQTYVHAVYGTRTRSFGRLSLKRPGKMVWDYAKAADPDFYADGQTLWVVERDTRQVVRKKVDESDFAGAVQFLFGGRKLLDDFFVRWAPDKLAKRYGMAGHVVIELKPKRSNPHYKRLLLVVEPASGRVDAFVVRNGDDSVNHFVLSELRTNSGLPDARFRFSPPKGYDVIDE